MTPRTRTRLVWLLAAVTAAHALASMATFLATGTFPAPLLVASLVVYGVLLIAALAMLASRRPRVRRLARREGEPAAAPEASKPRPPPEPRDVPVRADLG